jgi:hypothetical protein
MIHLRAKTKNGVTHYDMTKHDKPPPHGDNAPQPVRGLRDWLDHMAARERVLVLKPNLGLRFELAAHAKRLDGLRATVFPRPDGHAIPVVSGLVSDRAWIAEAMGVEPADMLARFQEAALNPVPWREVASAPAQEMVHRDVALDKILPLPTHNEHDGGPYIAAGIMIVRNPRTGRQNVSIHRCQLTGPNRLGVLVLPRHTFAFHRMAETGRPTARCRAGGRRRSADAARLAGDRADRPRRAGDRGRAARPAIAGGEVSDQATSACRPRPRS